MTDIATNLSTIDGSLSDIKTAIVAKGVTPSGNITTYATAIGNISSGGGGEFQLTRFKDDTNTEIGTHICNFTDANNTTYKVILLDAVYRSDSAQWCDDISASVTNMPQYQDLLTTNVWEAKESATTNTQLILDYCSAHSYTSTACSHCRSKSFTVGGTTYYGQFPNAVEVMEIAKHYHTIESMDTTASSNPSTNFSSARNIWSSSQSYYMNGWYLDTVGRIQGVRKGGNYFACPVLEIPNS